MMTNMSIYAAFQTTPSEARKPISGGRLKGFTDINPMWRIKKLTEQFGPCGLGWYIQIVDQHTEVGADGEVKAFATVNLFVKFDGEWSAPIQGVGGASFVAKEKGALYTDDECYKKAVTDAIGSCCKLLGMSADIYFDKDRTKYTVLSETEETAKAETFKADKAERQAKYFELVSMLTPEQQIALENQKQKKLEMWSIAEITKTINKINERNSKNA